MSSSMHPADPAVNGSTNGSYVTPNMQQPNAPLASPQYHGQQTGPLGLNAGSMPPQAFTMPSSSSNMHNSMIPSPGASQQAPVQFLDPATLSNYPVTAKEVLKRASESAAIAQGTPEWEEARQKVMNSLGSTNISSTDLQAPKPRGRPRGRPRKHPIQQPTTTHADVVAAQAHPSSINTPMSQVVGSTTTLAITPPVASLSGTTTPTPTRGRGRGRPKGRGGVRGGKASKRKRDEDEESEDEGDSSDSETHILETTTFTKSGRTVNKPTAYMPIIKTEETPGNGSTPRRKKRVYRQGLESALCAKCDRGHSTASNVVVFCDGCNTAWHQWCHDPRIGREVVDIPEKEWFCSVCAHEREMDGCSLEQRIDGQSMALSFEENNTYFSTLSSITLRYLLLRAVELHPDLPIFPPNTRQLTKNVPRPSPPPPSLFPNRPANDTAAPAQSLTIKLNTSQAPLSHQPTHPAKPQITTSNDASHPPTSSTAQPLSLTSATSKPLTTHIHRGPAGIPSSTTVSASAPDARPNSPHSTSSSLSSDPYYDYDNPYHDPPYTYPRPGTGPIPLRPTTDAEDRVWLEGKEKDNAGVFSHLVKGEGAGARMKRIGGGGEGMVGEGDEGEGTGNGLGNSVAGDGMEKQEEKEVGMNMNVDMDAEVDMDEMNMVLGFEPVDDDAEMPEVSVRGDVGGLLF